MAFSVQAVPVEIGARPVQFVCISDLFIRVEMKPALSALLSISRIPGDRQRLQMTFIQLNQILLKRLDTKHVLDFIIAQLAVRTDGP